MAKEEIANIARQAIKIISPKSHHSPQSQTLSETMPLAGKVAVITGASKGIGKATALRLARDGASVVINYNSDSKSADALVHQIGVDKALAVQADASKVADIEKLVNATVEKFKKIDILIPCAGILPMSPLESTTEELFDQIFSLNVKGPYFLCQVR